MNQFQYDNERANAVLPKISEYLSDPAVLDTAKLSLIEKWNNPINFGSRFQHKHGAMGQLHFQADDVLISVDIRCYLNAEGSGLDDVRCVVDKIYHPYDKPNGRWHRKEDTGEPHDFIQFSQTQGDFKVSFAFTNQPDERFSCALPPTHEGLQGFLKKMDNFDLVHQLPVQTPNGQPCPVAQHAFEQQVIQPLERIAHAKQVFGSFLEEKGLARTSGVCKAKVKLELVENRPDYGWILAHGEIQFNYKNKEGRSVAFKLKKVESRVDKPTSLDDRLPDLVHNIKALDNELSIANKLNRHLCYGVNLDERATLVRVETNRLARVIKEVLDSGLQHFPNVKIEDKNDLFKQTFEPELIAQQELSQSASLRR